MPSNLTTANKKALRARNKLKRDCKKALDMYYNTIESIQLSKKGIKTYANSKQVGSWNNSWYLRTNDLVKGIGRL